MHAPQIILLLLTTFAVFVGPIEAKNPLAETGLERYGIRIIGHLINAIIMIVLLIWGGFFGEN